jgi:transcriptional regulator with XRE-family HTH domain
MGFMKNRLKLLRKSLKLTQEEFASRIGIKRNSYANYEIGRNKPIDAVVFSICREYSVSENWLRTGEGEMFVQFDEEARAKKWVHMIFTDEKAVFQRRFIMMMLELNPEQWKTMEALTCSLVGVTGKEKNQIVS